MKLDEDKNVLTFSLEKEKVSKEKSTCLRRRLEALQFARGAYKARL